MKLRTRLAPLVAAAVIAQRVPAQRTAGAATPIGVWRGSSICLVRPSPCNDESVVYRVARAKASDSVTVDALKIVAGREEDMGVLACGVAARGTELACPFARGVWRFTIRGDSLVGELRLPDGTKFRDVRAARAK